MRPFDRRRCAIGAALAMLMLIVSSGFVEAGADDPATPPTTLTEPAPPVDSSSTLPGETPGGVTTTTDPDAPPVTSGPGGFGGPQVDPDAPPEPPMDDPSPQVRILLSQLLDQQRNQTLVRKAKVVEITQVGVSRFELHEVAARRTLERSQAALSANKARIAKIESDLRADALARYMDPGATGIQRMVNTNDPSGRTRAVLVEVNTGLHLQQRLDALAQKASIEQRIERDLAALGRAKAATARERERAKRIQDFAGLETVKVDLAREMVDTPNQAGTSDWSLPIAGESVFTAAELAEWFIQRGFPSRAQAPITELAKYYIDEGADQGIRGDMAFAQSILETGSFTNRDTIFLNNYAGVGHCDTCADGFAFATPQMGVRGQIQLLADYTQRDVVLAHPLVDRRLHGPSGCCQTWWQLTHTWATAGNYGPKIMGVYREMLYWLVLRRGMTPLVGPR